jgi:hypothetical protein
MASKSSSPGPNATMTTPAAKQTRSRKAAAPITDVGRAGSAGGIVLDKQKDAKPKSTPVSKPAPTQNTAIDTSNKTPRRKPRKLNKDPTQPAPNPSSKDASISEQAPPSSTEIEALKSRVRGLEAKVEELYKSGSLDRPGRSPRRRGKGRKASSQQQVPTLNTASRATVEDDDDDDDDDVEEIGRGDTGDGNDNEDVQELVKLEGELEVARRDLDAFKPRKRGEDDIEEIPRDEGGGSGSGRHVTLSGSYRIPLPASVSVDDVKHIQSGVSAAQNVARSFLEQRRAATIKSSPSSSTPQAKRPTPRSVSSSMQVIPADEAGDKKSWSEWIGGYSVAISRAVKNIEHEAAVESQRAGSGGAKKAGPSAKKRPGVKTKLSGDQVEGLMG